MIFSEKCEIVALSRTMPFPLEKFLMKRKRRFRSLSEKTAIFPRCLIFVRIPVPVRNLAGMMPVS